MDRRSFIRICGLGSGAFFAPGPAVSGRLDKDAYLRQVDRIIARGPFDDTWDSLKAYVAPAWYRDAKFGIFIHWGVYSVPGMWSEWYPREMYRRKNFVVWNYHRMKWGKQDEFGYKDFIPMFKAENFDADQWAELFRNAGARYVVPVAEHHDGFPMYDCGFTEWNAARMGPKRDVIRELAGATRRHGMWFGLSSHRAAHWWFMNGGRNFKSDVNDPRYQSFYGPAQPRGTEPDDAFKRDWLARSAELVDLYKPHIFWFDFGFNTPTFEPYRRKLAAYYYNRAKEWSEEVVLNHKDDAFPDGAAVLDLERAGLSEIRPMVWQTDTSVSFISWGYVDPRFDRFKSAGRLVDDLVDTVSKNGVLLLNVGPRPDGTIPGEARDILLEMGKWLSVNGEAIYKTRPWQVFGEGPNHYKEKISKALPYLLMEASNPRLTSRDIRFTTRGDLLYAIVMAWPRDRKVSIKSLGKKSGHAVGEVSSVRLLGHTGPALEWRRDHEALDIFLPPDKPCEHAFALEVRGLLDRGQ
jgi:alpha-L-fucosidase